MSALSALFQPIAVNGCTIRNRIVQPAQGTGFTDADGSVTPRLVAFHEAKARGGVGLIVFEATAVDPVGKISPIQPMLDDDRFIPGFATLAERVHHHGARILVQLCHHGRMSTSLFTGSQPVGPSARPHAWRTVHKKPHWFRPPERARALSEREIAEIVQRFGAAARRAKEAGLDGVEIHGAHGYLISEFLSPLTNRRRDRYGGDRERRLRFALEIVEEVRRQVGPDFLVSFKINGADYVEGGQTLADTCWYAERLAAAGIDLLSVSAGIYGALPPTIPPMWEPHGLFLHLAAAVKQHVAIPVVGGGRIVDPRHAEELLRDGKADLIAMGRALMADPDLPRKAQAGDFAGIRRCIGCNQCLELPEGLPEFGIHCVVNPGLGQEERRTPPPPRRRLVLVIGGGIAGRTAAATAAARGHRVVLRERQRFLGGQLRTVACVPGLAEYQVAVADLEEQLRRLGVEVQYGSATLEFVHDLRPDTVVVATGAELEVPPIPGLDPGQCVAADLAIRGDAEIGYRVIVQGEDLLAFEAADVLAQRGKLVTVVEVPRFFPLDVMHVGLTRFYLRNRLALWGVRIVPSTGIVRVEAGRAIALRQDGSEVALPPVDTYVFAHRRARTALAAALREVAPEVHVIGDAQEPRKSLHAAHDGYRVGSAL